MFCFRSLGFAILAITLALSASANGANIIAPLSSGEPHFKLVSGCGLGVNRGPYNDCSPVYRPIHRKRYAYGRGYYRGYREGYYQGYGVHLDPYVSYYRAPYVFGRDCGLGYDIVATFGTLWRRCW
jgi:hypothetical protein